MSTDTETQHVDIAVKDIIKHPQYDKADGHSDLAILVLESPITFSSKRRNEENFVIKILISLDLISPVCIPLNEPEKSRNFNGFTPFAAGWGRTQEGGKSANVLQEIQLPVVSNSECQSSYQAINKVVSGKQFDNGVICAGYKEGGRDTCNGKETFQ